MQNRIHTLVSNSRAMSRRGNTNSDYINFSANADSYDQAYNYSSNEVNDYGYEGSQSGSTYNYNSYNNDNYNSYSAYEQNSNYVSEATNAKLPAQTNFPVVKPPSIIQDSYQEPYGARPPSHSSRPKNNSWISAFGSGGFDDEPPLLEELGINFSHIKNKVL